MRTSQSNMAQARRSFVPFAQRMRNSEYLAWKGLPPTRDFI